MPQYFNFSRLIEKYMTEFHAIIMISGYFDDAGDWQKGEVAKVNMNGAIISFKDSKIFRSEGTLTSKDRNLFMLEPIPAALYGSKVVYDDNTYSIVDNTENAEFTGVWAYTLKYVSAFKDATAEYDITIDLEELEQRLDGEHSTADAQAEFEQLSKRLDGKQYD